MTFALISAAGFSQDYFEGIVGLKFLSTDSLTLNNVFVWQNDTIRKDSLTYAEIDNDCIRFKYINGAWTSWFCHSDIQRVLTHVTNDQDTVKTNELITGVLVENDTLKITEQGYTWKIKIQTSETDPIYSAWDKDYNDLINKPDIDGKVSDTAYSSGWDGVTTIAPSKNATYDKINAIDGSISSLQTSKLNVNTTDALSSNQTYYGVYDTGTVGENVSFGDVLYLKLSDQKWWKAKADAYATTPAQRMALGTISANASGSLLIEGRVRNDSWTFTDANVYLSAATAGAMISGTSGLATTNHVQKMGVAYGTSKLYFKPSVDVAEVGSALSDTLFTTIAISDETTALTTGTAKRTFRMPVKCTITKVRANVVTAPTGATLIFDINEAGTSILSTKLSIDASEKTSVTAASAAVISDSAIANDAEMTIDIDQIGSTIAGAGAKITLYYLKN